MTPRIRRRAAQPCSAPRSGHVSTLLLWRRGVLTDRVEVVERPRRLASRPEAESCRLELLDRVCCDGEAAQPLARAGGRFRAAVLCEGAIVGLKLQRLAGESAVDGLVADQLSTRPCQPGVA